jgi:ATP phosphoribosyltransferase regulatory subunit
MQAGIESVGRTDAAAADAEILGLAVDGLARLAVHDTRIRIGDMGLLDAMIEALGVAPAEKRRLIRAVVSGRGLPGEGPAAPAGASLEHAGLLAAIEGQAPQAARAFVEDILSIAGIARVGGRTAGEIAERFLARAANPSGLGVEARGVLERYLSIAGDPDEAADAVRGLARTAGLDVDDALRVFEERNGFIAARGLDIASFEFSAAFARNIDYYTGFIFEIEDPARSDGKPLVGGGRYDRLLQHLGAREPVPAVGCAFWLERIEAHGARR